MGSVGGVTRGVTPYREHCSRSRCPDTVSDGKSVCAYHDSENQRAAEAMAGLRRRRAIEKRCSFCNGKLAKPDIPKRDVATATCRKCRKERNDVRVRESATAGVTSVVTPRRDRVASRLIPWTDSPANAGRRNRLRGGRRGAPSKAGSDSFEVRIALKDVSEAADLLAASEEHADRREQERLHKDAIDKVALASRALDDVLLRRKRPVG